MKHLDVFLIFIAVRIASIFVVRTFYVPDEYYQSLEVAHNMIFGYGYLTWEWKLGIRSYIYPFIFSGLYKMVQVVGLDDPLVLIYGPRILQAILSAYADLCFYRWSGSRKWAIFSIASSWFWFYTASRTLINTFECALTTIALSLFPWLHKGDKSDYKFLWLVAILCCVRPTAIIVWIPLCLYHLAITRESYITVFMREYLPIGLSVFLVTTFLDTSAHGSFVITGYEFFKYNVFEGIGSFYGSHPWHWYLSTGFPVVLGVHLVPFALSTLVVTRNRKVHPNELALLATIVFTVAVYSFLPHKEFRFLLPILPMALYITSRFLAVWSCKVDRSTLSLVASIMLLSNLFPAIYVGYYHQRGTVDVMEPLREIARKDPSNTSFLFLMPCHSTPLYSHLHTKVSARFLTCEPNFNKTATSYLDEADRFYKDPPTWLRTNYPPTGPLPSHLIMFDNLVPRLSDILSRYKKVQEIFHTSFTTSSRVGQFVVIFERIDFPE